MNSYDNLEQLLDSYYGVDSNKGVAYVRIKPWEYVLFKLGLRFYCQTCGAHIKWTQEVHKLTIIDEHAVSHKIKCCDKCYQKRFDSNERRRV